MSYLEKVSKLPCLLCKSRSPSAMLICDASEAISLSEGGRLLLPDATDMMAVNVQEEGERCSGGMGPQCT